MSKVSKSMIEEQFLIEGLRAAVEHYVQSKNRPSAEDALTNLARHLRQRIRLEESKLFPALEALEPSSSPQPAARLRRQHVVILELVAAIERAIRQGEWAGVSGDLRELKAALHIHMEDERKTFAPFLLALEKACA